MFIISGPATLLLVRAAPVYILASAAALGTLSVAPTAAALGPVDVEVAAKVGGGTSPVDNGVDTSNGGPPGGRPMVWNNPVANPLGFGFGMRAGASFHGFYAGLSFMYYVGESAQVVGLYSKARSVLYGVEGGYGIGLGPFTLRPQLGVGNYTLTQSGIDPQYLQNVGPSTVHYLYLEPGVTGLVTFGGWMFGADANVLFLPGWNGSKPGSNSEPAFTAHGQVGIKFRVRRRNYHRSSFFQRQTRRLASAPQQVVFREVRSRPPREVRSAPRRSA